LAKTYQYAYDVLSSLRDKYYSTGNDHQKWVDYENIVNGCMAAMDLGLACFVNVEIHDDSSFNGDQFQSDSRLIDYFDVIKHSKSLKIERGIWIPFDTGAHLSYDKKVEAREDLFKKRCTSLFTTLPVTPYS
jgi:hypothetical protein